MAMAMAMGMGMAMAMGHGPRTKASASYAGTLLGLCRHYAGEDCLTQTPVRTNIPQNVKCVCRWNSVRKFPRHRSEIIGLWIGPQALLVVFMILKLSRGDPRGQRAACKGPMSDVPIGTTLHSLSPTNKPFLFGEIEHVTVQCCFILLLPCNLSHAPVISLELHKVAADTCACHLSYTTSIQNHDYGRESVHTPLRRSAEEVVCRYNIMFGSCRHFLCFM